MTDEPKTTENPAAPPAAESELEKLKKDAAANLELAKRAQAELANAQSRWNRDVETTRKFAVESMIRELLPVFDSLGKAVEAGQAGPALEAMKIIEKEALRVLAKFGVAPIETKGKKFDPLFHEAVTMTESAEHEDQAIVSELRRGWMMYERVLRPAHVVVARKKKAETPKA
jgi:molecular chaperone GrpE